MKRIVGVFQTEDQAVKAIRDLKTQGYKGEEISVVTNDKADFVEIKELAGNVRREEFQREEDPEVYNVSSGEGTGSFIKTLRSYGVSETDALMYEDKVNAGNIMVLLGFGEIIKGHIENPGTYTDPLIGDEIIETPGTINIQEELGGENETPGTYVDPISPTDINETPGTISDPFRTDETETPGTYTLDDDKK